MLKDYFSNRIVRMRYSVGDICYVFVSDETLLRINREFLNHDYFTDIVAFDYNNNNIVNGEIYISVDTVRKNSLKYDVSFKCELFRVMIHGLLHLTGFDDTTESERLEMRKGEDSWINEYLETYGKFDF